MTRPKSRSLAIVLAVLAAACSDAERPELDARGGRERPRRAAPPAVVAETAAGPRIVVLGDSLTAGLGLSRDEAFPALLQRRLDEAGYDYEVVNGGVSGDTTAGGVRRLDWALEGDVRVLIVALGGNDGLRGLPVAEMKRNLATIVRRARARGVTVLLAGMEAPPNFGSAYTVEFRQAFRDVARDAEVAFVPFLLEGVAGEAHLNQNDGIHPNPDGARRIAEHLWPALESLVTGDARTASAPAGR